jgi:hypothetical protein
MRRLLASLAIALLGFYVAWPAWSGYVIREALRSQDAARLASKINFERVRASLLPVVTAKVDEGVGRYQSQLGGAGAILLEQFKKDALPKVVDATLRVLVTPQMIIRLASEAGPIREGIDRVVREQLGRRAAGSAGGSEPASPQAGGQGLGGLLGKVLKRGDQQPAAAEPAAPTPTQRTYSLENIKSLSLNGPLSFRIGIAKDPAATEPDITAEMSFTGFDWKLTGLIPK